MQNQIISVRGISKMYRLGQVGTGTLIHDLNRWWHLIRGKDDPYAKIAESNFRDSRGNSEYVWSLKDISFDVAQGDVLGIIGRNGAGKSTLLKILSRITAPTSGKAKIKGRVASLLEVGTGFHPELTGRENIFLNGSILGMRKAEIQSKFDDIVAFSGVERYVDTPVKRYSSGMYVRLAFAVAAHLEPEILIVDEVLAVGDAEFQKKCLGKMKDVSTKEGRTVLFVSHNMAAVKSLCTKGIVLAEGKKIFEGNQLEAVHFYQNNQSTNSSFKHHGALDDAPGNQNIRILSFEVFPYQGDILQISSGFQFQLIFYNFKERINLDATFELKTIDEIPIFHQGTILSENRDSIRGIYKVIGVIPPNLINSGIYKFKLIFGENQRYPLYIAEDFVQFEILNEMSGSNSNQLPGVIRPQISFQKEILEKYQQWN